MDVEYFVVEGETGAFTNGTRGEIVEVLRRGLTKVHFAGQRHPSVVLSSSLKETTKKPGSLTGPCALCDGG